MTIAIGADQGGFELKQAITQFLGELGHPVSDLGIHTLESIDYPDIAVEVAQAVASGKAKYGIVICGTGIGVSMAANKVSGIRAALCTNAYMARMAREHNQAQVLCLGGRVIGTELAKDIIEAFLSSEFEGGRHARRVSKINALDEVG